MPGTYYYHERQLGGLASPSYITSWRSTSGCESRGLRATRSSTQRGTKVSSQPDATFDQLKRDRNLHHDLMHAGVDPKYLPMSAEGRREGVDVASRGTPCSRYWAR